MAGKKSSTAVAEKPKPVRRTKKVKDVEPEPTPPKIVEKTQEPEKEVEQDVEKNLFVGLLEKLASLTNELKEVTQTVKTLQKSYNKLEKQTNKKKKTSDSKREPSGFAKPTEISDELCKFLDVPEGSMMARTEVTKKINAYIKAHNLQKPEDRRNILPDKKLAAILSYSSKDDGPLTYFNLQRFLKRHFKKDDEEVAAK